MEIDTRKVCGVIFFALDLFDGDKYAMVHPFHTYPSGNRWEVKEDLEIQTVHGVE